MRSTTAARVLTGAALVAMLVAGCRGTTDEARSGDGEAGSSSTAAAATATSSTVSSSTAAGEAAPEPMEAPVPVPAEQLEVVAHPVPAGSRPHDVAPADDGGVWYTGQGSGELGWLDPETGEVRRIALGPGSRPHGVIVGDDGRPWVTDGGLNAIVVVDPGTGEVTTYPLPDDRPDANLNTAAFAADGRLWFTGQNGIHGVLDPDSGVMEVYDSPRGRGPYGIDATPAGEIYYSSLAGSYLGRVAADGSVTELNPPTPGQGARRIWSDSTGRLWVSEWNAGQLARHDPFDGSWTEWPLPGSAPRAYAVYVDEADLVWVSDFGGDGAIHRFDPETETFDTFDLPHPGGDVRQLLGRPGEIWGAESAADHLVVIRATG